jgi:hypothetical protein
METVEQVLRELAKIGFSDFGAFHTLSGNLR